MRIDQLDNIDNEKVDLLSNEGSVFPNTQVRSIMPKNKNGNKQKRLAKKITPKSSPANPTVETVEDDEYDPRRVKANVIKHLADMYTDAKKDGGYTSEKMRFALYELLHDMDMAGYMNSDYYDIEGFFHKGIDIKADKKINMGMLKKAYAQAKNLDTDTSVDPEIFNRGGSAMKHVATESMLSQVIREEHTKYALIRYPDTAISYIKNDGNGWEHIYDRSYGYKGPVDKDDMQYASHIEKEKIPSRMFKEAEQGSTEYYRDLDKGQLNHTKLMLEKSREQLKVAIAQRHKFSKELMGTGDRAGTGDLYKMLDELNHMIENWDEATKIYGM